ASASKASAPDPLRTSVWMRSAAIVFHIVILRLPELEAHEPRRSDLGRELAPTRQYKVFRGGNGSRQEGDVEVQVLVIEMLDKFPLGDLLEMTEVHHVAGVGIHLALDRDLERVVVAVVVRVVALPERGRIALVAPRRIVDAVAGVELDEAGGGDDGHTG